MDIRGAVADDADAICTVLRRSITELCQPDHKNDEETLSRWLTNKTPATIASWIAHLGNTILVATDGDVVAVGGVTADGEITLNYVLPNYRFRGLSRAMLSALEARAARQGNTTCRVTSTKTALRFYEAQGYVADRTTAGREDTLFKALPVQRKAAHEATFSTLPRGSGRRIVSMRKANDREQTRFGK